MNLQRGMALLAGSAALAVGVVPGTVAFAATSPGSCYVWDSISTCGR